MYIVKGEILFIVIHWLYNDAVDMNQSIYLDQGFLEESMSGETNPLIKLEDKVISQSAVFIEDGIYHRTIDHKTDSASLKIYHYYYSRPMRWLVGLVIFINLMLSFFEYPSSITLSSDYRFREITWHFKQPRCHTTEIVEMICLLVFVLDCSGKCYLLGCKGLHHQRWQIVYAFMILVSYIDIIVSLNFCQHRDSFPLGLAYTLRIRRFFRPFFLLISSSIMKTFTKAALLTLPHIFKVIFLLALHIYVFAMFGLLLFPRSLTSVPINGTNETTVAPSAHIILSWLNTSDSTTITDHDHYQNLESMQFFNSTIDALTSLLVLLTMANNPDIMIPIYQYNRFSALYFIIFLIVGVFIIFNLFLAATFNQFKHYFHNTLQSLFLRRRIAFAAAFLLLAREYGQRMPQPEDGLQNTVVKKSSIEQLLNKISICSKKVKSMKDKLTDETVNWTTFCETFDIIFQRSSPTTNNNMVSNSNIYRWIQWVIQHQYFHYIVCGISILNVILITVELEIAYEDSFTRTDSRMAYYNLIFVVIYGFEQFIKLMGYGCRGYFNNISNICNGLLTFVLVVLEILVIILFNGPGHLHDPLIDLQHLNTIIRLFNIFIFFRTLLILIQIENLRFLIFALVDVLWNLRGFSGIVIVIYYIFAFLGMELFYNVDGPSDPKGGCTPDYDTLQYYANNFHDFGSSLVVLWDVMVVNNWFVFLDKFACDSFLGQWAKLYFIAWWIVSIIILNLFIALVLDIFLIKWKLWHKDVSSLCTSLRNRQCMRNTTENQTSTRMAQGISEVCSIIINYP